MSFAVKALGTVVTVGAVAGIAKFVETRDDWKDAPRQATGENLGRLWTGNPGTEPAAGDVTGPTLKIGRQLDKKGYASFDDAARAARSLGDEAHAIVTPNKVHGDSATLSGRYYIYALEGSPAKTTKLADSGDSRAYLMGGKPTGVAADEYFVGIQDGNKSYGLTGWGPGTDELNVNRLK